MPSNNVTCQRCRTSTDPNEIRYTYNEQRICPTCFENSGHCPVDGNGNWYPTDMLTLYDGEYYLYSPAPVPDASESEWQDDDTQQGREDEYSYASSPGDERHAVRGYHSSVSRPIPGSEGSTDTMGFELEVVPKRNSQNLARFILDTFGGRVERDGSLPSHGFEIISDYGLEHQVLDIASRLSDRLTHEQVRSHNTGCCGLHVHLSKTNATLLQISRMVYFWNNPTNKDFLHKFARRWGVSFCRDIPAKGICVNPQNARRSEKYELVNVLPQQTIEVRAFRGTTKKSTLLACIQLAKRTWDFCRDLTVPDVDLTWMRFMDWVPQDATHVIAYANSAGFMAPGREWASQEPPLSFPAVEMLLQIGNAELQNTGIEFFRTVSAHGYFVTYQCVFKLSEAMARSFAAEAGGTADPRELATLHRTLHMSDWQSLETVTMSSGTADRVRSIGCHRASNGSFYDSRYINAIRSAYPQATFRVVPETKNLIAINNNEPVVALAHRIPN